MTDTPTLPTGEPNTSTPTAKQPWSINTEQLREIVNANKTSWMAAGIILVVLGLFCILMPFVAGVWTVLLLGIGLIISGISTVIHGFKSRGWAGFAIQILLGALYAAIGVLLAANPLKGVVAVTLIVGVLLLVDGATRLALAFRIRNAPGWNWLLGGGVLSLLLGLIVVMEWPGDSAWVLGLFIGIDLLMFGLTLIGIASAVGKAAKS